MNPMRRLERLLHAMLLCFAALVIAGCSSQTVTPSPEMPVVEPIWRPLAQFPGKYVLRPGDVLDVVYQVRAKEVSEYHLEIQDVVELRFVSMPEQNQEQIIRADGLVTLPWIGDVRVLGLTPKEATQKIRRAYQGILRDPDVYLIVKESGASLNEFKRAIAAEDEEQSKLLTIRPDGFITLPMVGEMRAAGKSVKELTVAVNRAYHAYYPELFVDVILDKSPDQRIYVIGEVNKPGAFVIYRPTEIGQALAMAGGPNIDARLNEVIIVRHDGKETKARKVDYKSIVEGYVDQSALLLPDDVVYVPRRPLATAAQISFEIRRVLMFRGWQLGNFSFGTFSN